MVRQVTKTRVAGCPVRCMLCRVMIPKGSTYLNKEGFTACTKHRDWLDGMTIPVSPARERALKRAWRNRNRHSNDPRPGIADNCMGCGARLTPEEKLLLAIIGKKRMSRNLCLGCLLKEGIG